MVDDVLCPLRCCPSLFFFPQASFQLFLFIRSVFFFFYPPRFLGRAAQDAFLTPFSQRNFLNRSLPPFLSLVGDFSPLPLERSVRASPWPSRLKLWFPLTVSCSESMADERHHLLKFPSLSTGITQTCGGFLAFFQRPMVAPPFKRVSKIDKESFLHAVAGGPSSRLRVSV